MKVNFPRVDKLINTAFIPSWYNRDRVLIEWGGRGSSKSVFAAQKLVVRCLREKYFRYILYRNVFDTIRDSSYQTIKDVVEDWGLQDLFHFTKSPLEITCVNGNKFYAKGGDKTSKIKSIKDPTGIWFEEDIPEEEGYYDIIGSVRTSKAEYIQEIFTMNPEVEGHYEDNWFFQKFFKGRYPAELSFQDTTITTIDNEDVELSFFVHHSDHWANRFLPKEYRAVLMSYKETNEYKYTVHTLGHWGVREIGDRFWKNFTQSKHVHDNRINLDLPLHISFDENVRPYPALSIWQIDGLKVTQLHEICLRTPKNKLKYVASEFTRWAKSKNFKDVVIIYGDASSDKDDAKLEKGHNYWTMLQNEINKNFTTRVRKPSKNPPVAISAEWINEIFAANEGGISISIDSKCRESINDYQFCEEAQDGTMKKNKVDGIELLGHISDTFRYFMCKAFEKEFLQFQNKNTIFRPTIVKRQNTKRR
jgi:hypothetical protein